MVGAVPEGAEPNKEERMALEFSICEVRWERYRRVSENPHGREWLKFQATRGLAANTLDAYGRDLDAYLGFLESQGITLQSVVRPTIGAYVRSIAELAVSRVRKRGAETRTTLANATLQQHLTVVRLFHDFLVEERICTRNPLRPAIGGRSLIQRHHRLPWIPNEEEWQSILEVCKQERLRNRVMLAMSYDAALRREEICSLETTDIDPAHRLLRIRLEVTKNRRERVVPYSPATSELFGRYLRIRRELSRERGPLFLSESDRNQGQPISIWTWSKAIARVAQRCNLPRFTPHSLRHLCLTDLARANWDIHEIATFAGHRSIQTTTLYIHLSGRDLANKFARGMAEIHARRVAMMTEVLA
jgi:integrase/recombinase XerD